MSKKIKYVNKLCYQMKNNEIFVKKTQVLLETGDKL